MAQVAGDASDAQLAVVAIAASCVVVALIAAWGERRRARRHDPDAIGWVDWTTVQMLALIGLAGAVLLIARGQ